MLYFVNSGEFINLDTNRVDGSGKVEDHGGEGRIRTCVALRAADLQSAPINHSGTSPRKAVGSKRSPRRDSNPSTYRLQVGCATIALLGQVWQVLLEVNDYPIIGMRCN